MRDSGPECRAAPRLPWAFAGWVVSKDRNSSAGTIGDDIALFIDNSDLKSMRSAINVSECNAAVTLDVANFSTVHQKFCTVPWLNGR